ncbi:MAG: cupin domain-containing protein [Planctomycetota bacterium]
MRELEKGLDVSLKGPEAAEALSVFRRQMESWGLVMPPAEPLVFDFGLGNFDHTGHIECWIANEVEAGYCGKFIFVVDGQTCPTHHHREKHETFFLVKGRVRMVYDGTEREMAEGDVLPVDPGKDHCFTGMGPALLLEVSKPCLIDDNYFENPAIPIGGNYRGRNEA